MPVTRSVSRSASKRQVPSEETKTTPVKTPSKRAKTTKGTTTPASATLPASFSIPQPTPEELNADPILPAVLSFSFKEAKAHLISADARFEELFTKMSCKPYDVLEVVHPFRSLTNSILGQQISWMAARSIQHRFLRLYKPELPEKPTDYSEYKTPQSFYPTPSQVANTDVAVLKTAGLSQRKAEYVQDLARKFANGDLSSEKLLSANDDELAEMLIAVRGIGRWTVDMFAIFSLRRPNILPVGDLGVQKGLVRWFLALHSPAHPYSLIPEKLIADTEPEKEKEDGEDALPVAGQPSVAGISSVLPTETTVTGTPLSVVPTKPPAFTPSIEKTLVMEKAKEHRPPLPAGLTVGELKSRLDGKKKIKGAMLTPAEMEALTESWKPYRSLGVYFMWGLADGK